MSYYTLSCGNRTAMLPPSCNWHNVSLAWDCTQGDAAAVLQGAFCDDCGTFYVAARNGLHDAPVTAERWCDTCFSTSNGLIDDPDGGAICLGCVQIV